MRIYFVVFYFGSKFFVMVRFLYFRLNFLLERVVVFVGVLVAVWVDDSEVFRDRF